MTQFKNINCSHILLLLLFSCNTKLETSKAGKPADTVLLKNGQATSKLTQISAKPDSILIDPKKTAVLVVDMENDFCSKDGFMDKVGVNISSIKKIIKPTADLLDVAREENLPIIYLKMAFKPDLSDLGTNDSYFRRRFYSFVGDAMTTRSGVNGRFLIRETWNTDIIPELKPKEKDLIIYKTRFSGFYKTELDSVLQKLNIKTLIVVGCTTSICVESTVRDAMFRDYSTITLEDCTAEPDGLDFSRTNYDATIFIIQSEFGWVSDSRNFIHALKEKSGIKDLPRAYR